jgi:hypothetical protein
MCPGRAYFKARLMEAMGNDFTVCFHGFYHHFPERPVYGFCSIAKGRPAGGNHLLCAQMTRAQYKKQYYTSFHS